MPDEMNKGIQFVIMLAIVGLVIIALDAERRLMSPAAHFQKMDKQFNRVLAL